MLHPVWSSNPTSVLPPPALPRQVLKYLLQSSEALAGECERLMRLSPETGATAADLLEDACAALRARWPPSGPTRLALRNHMGKSVQVVHSAEEAAQSRPCSTVVVALGV